MKINTKQKLKDLEGNDLKDNKGIVTLGTVVSNILLTTKVETKLKMFILAQKILTNKEVDIDAADLDLIKKAIEQDQYYNNLACGQILLILNEKQTS